MGWGRATIRPCKVQVNPSDAQLVLLNMPGPPKSRQGDENCILFQCFPVVVVVGYTELGDA